MEQITHRSSRLLVNFSVETDSLNGSPVRFSDCSNEKIKSNLESKIESFRNTFEKHENSFKMKN